MVLYWLFCADAAGVHPELKEAEVKVLANGICRNTFRGIITGHQICVTARRDASPCKVIDNVFNFDQIMKELTIKHYAF